MRVFELPVSSSPREAGRAHGEAFRELIAEIADIRLGLTLELGRFLDREQILQVARAHLPVLEQWDSALHEELIGIAEGARISPERIVVLNHYTDLRDIVTSEQSEPAGGRLSLERASDRARGGRAAPPEKEEDCSAVYARASGEVILGQTWDTHGSAEPYVMMLRVSSRDGAPAAWLFSITGCLGMAGVNDAGVGLTINNLKSTDGRIGVLWPALVRRTLSERRVENARDSILNASIGSGRHYMVASSEGAFGIEASGELKQVVFDGGGNAFVHTNHCLDASIGARTTISQESTTLERYDALTTSVEADPIMDRNDLFRRLGSHERYPRSICTHLASVVRPHAMKTCGAIVMDLVRREALAAPGCIHFARPHLFTFASSGATT